MVGKPIFVATHPRACSTAFERVFMTRTDALQCVHEPFGDAFYYGPERLSSRFEDDEEERIDSGFSKSTYATIFDRFAQEEETSGKRLFIKDIIHYLFPPDGRPATIAPSLVEYKRGVGTASTHGASAISSSTQPLYPYQTSAEPGNPTIVPLELLKKFHFTFLIRHPRKSIPSYYRCTIPPLSEMTGFHNFMPSESGYDELRRFFDFLRTSGEVGPQIAGEGPSTNESNGKHNDSRIEICVIDADDLLDNPAGIIKAYCNSVGLDFSSTMLEWNTEEDHQAAKDAFEKWRGFHEDAIQSNDLKPRRHKARPGTPKLEDHEWETKYGPEAAQVIRATVDRNVEDYEYLKQFALEV